MIKSYRDAVTAALAQGYRPKGVPGDVVRRAQNKLAILNRVRDVLELRAPPANRLKKLSGNLAGLWSIRVNDQWRIVFEWRDSNAWEVWFGDYHDD